MTPLRVVVINLRRRPDRLAGFRHRWAAATGDAVFEIHDAADDPDDPVRGCWQSHLDALRAGIGPVLVLEDDCTFRAGFSLDLPDPPPDWTLLRLGGSTTGGQAVAFYLRVRQATHTHAYVARFPDTLAARIQAHPVRNVSQALMRFQPGHYRLNPACCGQAAGRSDVSGLDVPERFWK